LNKTTVYVDVLLVINYIINLLLILCTAKCVGVSPKRRRIVAAALFGSFCSLTIFFPFMGFFVEFCLKALISSVLVRIALPWYGLAAYLRHWFVFFAVNFFFAGIILALWMSFSPRWLTYYNGVVYFNVSISSLLIATIIAYLALLLANRMGRSGRLQGSLCQVRIFLGGKICGMTGLVDSGNSLCEPFSGAPVVVCRLEDVEPLLPPQAAEAIREGRFGLLGGSEEAGIPFRVVPYSGVGSKGILPAFAPDRLTIADEHGTWLVDSVYVAVSTKDIGDSRYRAILNPECMRIKIKSGGAKT